VSATVPILTGVIFKRTSQQYELWATFKGAPVQLFASRDAAEFGRVRRALVRALESAEIASTGTTGSG
jgi:hypothetical protein